jgi:hypothetical protein
MIKASFTSAFSNFKNTGKEIPFTSIDSKTLERETIDYIWHDDKVQVVKVLDLPEDEHLKPTIPNQYFPSDHLPIQCVLSIKKS